MKYAPLLWSALLRKPVEALLMLLAITAAFTLFGIMVGLNATYRVVVASARMDRIVVSQKFPDSSPGGMPLALGGVLARVDGVTAVGAEMGLPAYYQTRANAVTVLAMDEGMRTARSEIPLSAAQWDQLQSTPSGVFITRANARRLHLTQGDPFPLVPLDIAAVAGRRSLEFTVLGVMNDDPQWDYRLALANSRYVDSLRSPDQQGLVWEFRLAVRDPSRSGEIAHQIDRRFANSGTATRSQPLRASLQTSANFGLPIEAVTWTVGAAGLFVVLLLVGNAITESIDSRRAEFAVLSTIGFSNAVVYALIFAETLLPCMAGAVIASALSPRLAALPRNLIPPGFAGLPPNMFRSEELSWALVCALLLSLIVSVVPSLKLQRMNVAAVLSGR